MIKTKLSKFHFYDHTYVQSENVHPNFWNSVAKLLNLNAQLELWFMVMKFQDQVYKIRKIFAEQAWKLSAFKGEPNLLILWEKRQIHLKKAFSSQKVTSKLTQVSLFYDEKQFLQKSHYCQKAVSGQKVWSSLIHFRQIWSKKIKYQTVISILSVNVTNVYNNIFWLVKIHFDQGW
jgi:hypothetical protein